MGSHWSSMSIRLFGGGGGGRVERESIPSLSVPCPLPPPPRKAWSRPADLQTNSLGGGGGRRRKENSWENLGRGGTSNLRNSRYFILRFTVPLEGDADHLGNFRRFYRLLFSCMYKPLSFHVTVVKTSCSQFIYRKNSVFNIPEKYFRAKA